MRPVIFLGNSLTTIRSFPTIIRTEVGYELDKIQRGQQPKDWKSLSDLGAGIQELRIRRDGAWRVIYVANRSSAIYVLHAFQKKTQQISRADRARILNTLREVS